MVDSTVSPPPSRTTSTVPIPHLRHIPPEKGIHIPENHDKSPLRPALTNNDPKTVKFSNSAARDGDQDPRSGIEKAHNHVRERPTNEIHENSEGRTEKLISKQAAIDVARNFEWCYCGCASIWIVWEEKKWVLKEVKWGKDDVALLTW